MLDAGAFPHIFRAIVASTPPDGLISLRAACKSLRKEVDADLATHVLLWNNGRVSSRLLPKGRLPRPLSELCDHVKTLDIQPMDWVEYPPDSESGDDPPSQERPDAFPCGRIATHTLPLLPHLRTVRRWGRLVYWAPPARLRVTHYPTNDSEGQPIRGQAMWYMHSPSAMSRLNRLDIGFRTPPRYVMAGARTGALLDRIEEHKVKRAVDSTNDVECGGHCDAECSECDRSCRGEGQECGAKTGKGKVRTPASRADHFAALLAMLWLEEKYKGDEWVLVDVESWPQWEGMCGVAEAIRERLKQCCAAAGWNEAQMKEIERRLRFLSGKEYEEEIGEAAALELDDHRWRF